MEASAIVEMVLGGIVALMLYFLKVIHNDVRQNTKDVGENKGRIANVQSQVQHEKELRNQSFDSIMTILNEIKEELKQIKK